MQNNKEPALQHSKFVKKLTFAEAVAVAYSTRQRMGHDWRITNVKEDRTVAHSVDSPTLGAVSLS